MNKFYPGEIWRKVSEQLEASDSVDLTTKKRSGRLSILTPRKKKKLIYNSATRALTTRQLNVELSEFSLDVNATQLHPRLKRMGTLHKC